MAPETHVGGVRCEACQRGRVVALVTSSGREYRTDAEGTDTLDRARWLARVGDRVAEIPGKVERARADLAVKLALRGAVLRLRPCSECDGEGWAMRVVVAEAQDASRATGPFERV